MKVKKLHSLAKIPTRAHSGDAGLDLYSITKEIISPGETKLIPTGIALEIPFGYVGLIWFRSGLSSKYSLKVAGGVIDASYRGEIVVILINLGKGAIAIEQGQKIAQLLIQKVELVDIEEVESLDSTDRGEKGFGSTDHL